MIIAVKIILTTLVLFPAILLIMWIPRWCAEDDLDLDLPQWYLTLTDALYTAWAWEAVSVLGILIIVMFAVAILAIWRA